MNFAPTGRIEADFTACDGQTRLARLQCASPLKIAKTFARADGSLEICVMDASPGLLAGDCYQMEWRLEAGARVAVGTQGFTRVHPSRERPCAIQTRFQVAADAVLEWFPEPLMLYKDAALQAENTAFLTSGATFLAGEIWCAGRGGRGENFAFHRFWNRWRVRRDEELIFASSLDLRPQSFAPHAVGVMENWTHAGQLLVFSDAANDVLKEALAAILDEDMAPWTTLYAGVTALPQQGIMVSLLGRRAHDLQVALRILRAATRQHLNLD